ncbi:MAG: PrsW family glutamic-type intramembrane protease [Woeseiaceae bacterium]|nr:PrsW family glutamic-type intramembrane protease [Woeseiaceae bacterium]
MGQLLAIAPIAVPVLFWAAYHYHKDRHLPEPVGNLLLTFLLGMLAVGISAALYSALGVVGLRHDAGYLADTNAWALLAYAILAIGPIEEIAKLLPFVLVVLRFRGVDEPMDGIIYASFIGLGYAAVENWQYLPYLTTLEAAARGFASPVIHILFASIWGHWIVRARLAGRPILPSVILSTAAASALHGVYDFIVILNPRFALPAAGLMIAAIWIWRLRVLHKLHQEASQD